MSLVKAKLNKISLKVSYIRSLIAPQFTAIYKVTYKLELKVTISVPC